MTGTAWSCLSASSSVPGPVHRRAWPPVDDRHRDATGRPGRSGHRGPGSGALVTGSRSDPLRGCACERRSGDIADAHRSRLGRRRRVRLVAGQRPAAGGEVRTRPSAAREHTTLRARGLDSPTRPSGRRRPGDPFERGSAALAGARAHRADGRLSLRLPPRSGQRARRRLRRVAGHGDHARRVRRRAPRQLRVLRLPPTRPRVRPERLRRSTPGCLGVGPASAHHERVGGGPGERGEGDRRRPAPGVWVAGRENGASDAACGEAVGRCVEEYRLQIAALAEQPLLARSYEDLDVHGMLRTAPGTSLRAEIQTSARRARKRTSDRALPRITEERDGARRIVTEPPLLTRPQPAEAEQLAEALDAYLTTLPPHWARVVSGYRLVDIAHKVVGVGSVGLRAWVALCEGSSADDVLFLQLKQARRSVLAPFVHGESAWHAHQGQRVVEYQQAVQTVSDPLLGWTSVGDVQYYVRQFRDMKGAITLVGIDARALTSYAGICGYLLAKGHARTSGASMIAGYLGGGSKVREAFCRFARAYADQTERDHADLVRAVQQGILPAETGI